MRGKLGRIWEEMATACFKVLSSKIPRKKTIFRIVGLCLGYEFGIS
jgi:hypothetical protein